MIIAKQTSCLSDWPIHNPNYLHVKLILPSIDFNLIYLMRNLKSSKRSQTRLRFRYVNPVYLESSFLLNYEHSRLLCSGERHVVMKSALILSKRTSSRWYPPFSSHSLMVQIRTEFPPSFDSSFNIVSKKLIFCHRMSLSTTCRTYDVEIIFDLYWKYSSYQLTFSTIRCFCESIFGRYLATWLNN